MARPKRQFTDEEIQKIEQYARNNCYDRTISTALDIPINTLKRRFGTKIRRWRAQGKVELHQYQRELAKTNATMAIFLGKNELGQTDKQTAEVQVKNVEIKEEEREAVEAAAQAYKLRLAGA